MGTASAADSSAGGGGGSGMPWQRGTSITGIGGGSRPAARQSMNKAAKLKMALRPQASRSLAFEERKGSEQKK